jgi:hypothetical protein
MVAVDVGEAIQDGTQRIIPLGSGRAEARGHKELSVMESCGGFLVFRIVLQLGGVMTNG